MKRRQPPFGKTVPKTCLEVWIYFGSHAWEYRDMCRRWPGRLILPPDADPAEFRWPVRGREALAVEAPGAPEPEARILRLVAALRRDGATVVRAIHGEPPSLAAFRDVDVSHAA